MLCLFIVDTTVKNVMLFCCVTLRNHGNIRWYRSTLHMWELGQMIMIQ